MSKSSSNTTADFSILLIDDNEQRANTIIEALKNSRYHVDHLASSGASLLRQVDSLAPDIIVIDIESPDRDILESLHTLSHFNPKPVVMFSETEDSDTITRSVKSGVSAYVAGDKDPSRVRAILDAAVARFEEFQSMKQALDDTRHQLESKLLIDKAKRLLMQQQKISEDEAYKSMRKMAMDSGQKLENVAKTLSSIFGNLPTGKST